MSYNFLDKTGLTYFYDKIKTIFAKKSEIPTKTSQLTNDSHLNYSIEKSSGTIDDLAAFTSGKPGITGSISLNKKSSGVGSEIPAGWYNYYFAPHRTGSGGDNINFGTILLTPMTFSGASWILRRSSSTNAITEVKKIAVSTDIPTKTSQLTNDSSYIRNYSFYVNTHPENSPVLIPFVNNDIAFLLKRGGSVNISYDGVEKSIDISNAFDGSPSYGLAINPTGTTEIVIVLNLHKTFTWNNTIYSDFGSAGWRAKDVKIEVINTNYAQDVWTEKYHNTNNGSGSVYVTTAHTPVGASNQGGGFNKVRFTFKTWATATIFRISQLGIYNYGSYGSRETSMSRGVDDYIFRNITPNSNNTYDLGSSSNKWANVYATTFNGNATSATKATGDKNGADITTTYYKASNPNGYTSNTGTVTSVAVKMNNTTKGTVTTSGTIDLGTVITSHQDISGKQDKLATQTAYTSKGSATKVPQITTNTLGQVTGINEVTISQPTVNNGTLTIQKNGTNIQTFSANQSGNATANITVPTKVSELTNDSGYTKNTGTITGVSVNGTSVATSGVANITSLPASILNGAIKNGVTATTQNANDNSTKVATTAYVDSAVNSHSGSETPIGTILGFAGSTAPTGYLMCDGSAISRTDYADLFAVIGTTYGTGDGQSTFNLPNIQGKVPVGLDIADSDFNSLGKTGGNKNHNLDINEIYALANPTGLGVNYTNANKSFSTDYWVDASTSRTKGGGGRNNSNAGIKIGGTLNSGNNMSPFIVLNYIIKV